MQVDRQFVSLALLSPRHSLHYHSSQLSFLVTSALFHPYKFIIDGRNLICCPSHRRALSTLHLYLLVTSAIKHHFFSVLADWKRYAVPRVRYITLIIFQYLFGIFMPSVFYLTSLRTREREKKSGHIKHILKKKKPCIQSSLYAYRKRGCDENALFPNASDVKKKYKN